MAAGPRDAVPGGGRVFISYRRQDSAWPARQLYEALAARFGASNIFKDVDDIEPGEDFVDKITAAVAQCDVLLALIGPHWMSMADGKGQRRLDDPEDFVRVEIGAALARNVRVIPILIDGAPMPPAAELTPDLAPMVRRQAVAIDPVSFNTERLFATLADIFEAQATAAAQAAAEVASRTEAARAQAAREEAARAESAQQEAARVQAARDEAARGERAKQEAARADQARDEAAAAAAMAAEAGAGTAMTGAPTMGAGNPPAGSGHPSSMAPAGQPVDPRKSGPRRTPVAVLVAAGVAVALLATLLIWRPWMSNSSGASGPARPASAQPSTTQPSISASGPGSASPTAPASGVAEGPNAVWAHRGGLEEHQFETMQAMEAAARAGYGVETDVRYTSDGVAVLVHDEDAMKGLDCGGHDVQVSKTTWANLQKLCRSKPTAADPNTYPVPRFDQTMEAIAAASPTAWVYPEMKTDLSDAQVKKFVGVLIDNGLRGRAVVTSFSRDRLAQVRRLAPGTPTLLLMQSDRVPASELKGDDLWGVAVEKGIATKQYVHQLQANGSRVMLWLLNDTSQWNVARELGADTVMTDFPAKYTQWRATQ
ncbi:MAG TPA: glycerophosphodiester phosphodiesterase family protein [Micropruina sp.]|nr:glycerophosphodiester phosphodiesterase family protein [Micropruina sp.]